MEIKLLSNKELLDELFERFDHCAFIGMNIIDNKGNNAYTRKWKGNRHTGMGLAVDLQARILEDFKSMENLC